MLRFRCVCCPLILLFDFSPAADFCITLTGAVRSGACAPAKLFSVACTDYRRGVGLDADVVTWWAEEPVLKNAAVLRELKHLQVHSASRRVT